MKKLHVSHLLEWEPENRLSAEAFILRYRSEDQNDRQQPAIDPMDLVE